MRRIILNIASSLDGYIAREDGSIDWLPTDGGDFGMKIQNYSYYQQSIECGYK